MLQGRQVEKVLHISRLMFCCLRRVGLLPAWRSAKRDAATFPNCPARPGAFGALQIGQAVGASPQSVTPVCSKVLRQCDAGMVWAAGLSRQAQQPIERVSCRGTLDRSGAPGQQHLLLAARPLDPWAWWIVAAATATGKSEGCILGLFYPSHFLNYPRQFFRRQQG